MGNRRSIFLYPISIIWRIITDFRNFLYDLRILKSHKFDIPVICIGNLAAGGTGKTPHAEYLIDLLTENHFKVALLSRGYKRKTSGFLIAGPETNTRDIGDEPSQIHRKFRKIIVAVDVNRFRGISKILDIKPEKDVIILDDGYQHRKITPGLSILLTEFDRPVYKDHILPYGNLRESIRNIKRSNIILITKSPEDISLTDQMAIEKKIKKSSDQNVYFTTFNYKDPSPLFNVFKFDPEQVKDPGRGIVLVTGIANPKPLYDYLKPGTAEIIHLQFADHHNFTLKDIEKINDAWKSLGTHSRYVFTTEKDAVRLSDFGNIEEPFRSSFFNIPVEIKFINNRKEEFDNLIIDYVRKNKRNN